MQTRLLADGRRLHLQDGPIDLVIGAEGAPAAVAAAYWGAAAAMDGLLDALCADLALLRAPARPCDGDRAWPGHPAARGMMAAVAPFAAQAFVTPMAAVAGAVADDVLGAMLDAAPLERAYVNNGGDIALHCAPGHGFRIGLAGRPERSSLFGRAWVGNGDGVGGVATSGWRGRSFSFGIADSVTVLAATAAAADAAATMVANAVDLPGHPAVDRVPAASVQADSDLGERLVTREVGRLATFEVAAALDAGAACAETLLARGLILGVALQLQGTVRSLGCPGVATAVRFMTPGPGFAPARAPCVGPAATGRRGWPDQVRP